MENGEELPGDASGMGTRTGIGGWALAAPLRSPGHFTGAHKLPQGSPVPTDPAVLAVPFNDTVWHVIDS